MINNVTIVGRMTKSADLRYSQSGTAIARFTLAVNKFGKDEANFINCVAFKKTAEALANYTDKGSLVGVVGSIETGSYEKDGIKRYTTDIICNSIQFLDSKKESQQGNQPNYQSKQSQPDPFSYNGQPIDIPESDLPF